MTSTTVWLRRLWPAAALGAGTIVVGLGTATLVALQPPAPSPPSRATLALRSAHDDAARLADLARAAGQTAAAQMLDRQAMVLAAAPGVASASHSAGSPTSSSGTDASTTAARDLADGLSASVAGRLASLVDVDGPTSTVLASVAAGQSLQLDGVVKATGQKASPAPSSSPTPSRSCGPSTGSPSANSASANPASAALAAVARAEHASVYVLEAALARTPAGSGEAAGRTAALDGHRKQLVEVSTLATSLCTALPPQDPAFAVPSDFAANPDPTVGAAAASAEQAWAQLVGTLPPANRSSAATGLLAAARLAPDTAAPFPGIPAAAAPAS